MMAWLRRGRAISKTCHGSTSVIGEGNVTGESLVQFYICLLGASLNCDGVNVAHDLFGEGVQSSHSTAQTKAANQRWEGFGEGPESNTIYSRYLRRRRWNPGNTVASDDCANSDS